LKGKLRELWDELHAAYVMTHKPLELLERRKVGRAVIELTFVVQRVIDVLERLIDVLEEGER